MNKRPPINHVNKGAIWTKEEFIKEASRVHNNKFNNPDFVIENKDSNNHSDSLSE